MHGTIAQADQAVEKPGQIGIGDVDELLRSIISAATNLRNTACVLRCRHPNDKAALNLHDQPVEIIRNAERAREQIRALNQSAASARQQTTDTQCAG
jgi:hypothetical protein